MKCDHKFIDSNYCLKCGWKPALKKNMNKSEIITKIKEAKQLLTERYYYDGDYWAYNSGFVVDRIGKILDSILNGEKDECNTKKRITIKQRNKETQKR